jgi:hypothetical protein
MRPGQVQKAAILAGERLQELRTRLVGLGCIEAAIFAPGPSLPRLLEPWRPIIADRMRIVVNDAYKLMPEADVLFAIDASWWQLHKGVRGFAGAKLGYGDVGYPDIIALQGSGVTGYDPRLGWIRHCGNSGGAAIHLAAQLGAKRISLVGFDMRRVDGKVHYFGDHAHKPKPQQPDFPRWISAIKLLAKELSGRGIEVVNATPGSALRLG